MADEAGKAAAAQDGVVLPDFVDNELLKKSQMAIEAVLKICSDHALPEHLRADSIPDEVIRVHAAAEKCVGALADSTV